MSDSATKSHAFLDDHGLGDEGLGGGGMLAVPGIERCHCKQGVFRDA